MKIFYVIERVDQGGGFVTPPGSMHSYTKNLLKARRFQTFACADGARCVGNERVVEVVYEQGRPVYAN